MYFKHQSFVKLISSLFYTTFTNFSHFVRINLKTVLNDTYLFYLPYYMRMLLKTCLSLPFFKVFIYLPHFLRISLITVLNITYLFLLTSLYENLPQNWSVFTLLYDGYLSASLFENLSQICPQYDLSILTYLTM